MPKITKVTDFVFNVGLCDHNPPTLQTVTDRLHTIAILRIPANPAHQEFCDLLIN